MICFLPRKQQHTTGTYGLLVDARRHFEAPDVHLRDAGEGEEGSNVRRKKTREYQTGHALALDPAKTERAAFAHALT